MLSPNTPALESGKELKVRHTPTLREEVKPPTLESGKELKAPEAEKLLYEAERTTGIRKGIKSPRALAGIRKGIESR